MGLVGNSNDSMMGVCLRPAALDRCWTPVDVSLVLSHAPPLLHGAARDICWLQGYLQNLNAPPKKSVVRLGALAGQLPDPVAMAMGVAAYAAAKTQPALERLADHDVILTAPRWHLAQWSQQLWDRNPKAVQASTIAALCASAVLLQTALRYQNFRQSLLPGRMTDMLRQNAILPELGVGGFWPAIYRAHNTLLAMQTQIIEHRVRDPNGAAFAAGEEIQEAMTTALTALIGQGADRQEHAVIGRIGGTPGEPARLAGRPGR